MTTILNKWISSLLLSFFTISLSAASVSLEWDKSTNTDVAGYKLSVSTNDFLTTITNIDVPSVNTTNYTISLVDGPVYSFKMVCYNVSGLTSEDSNKIRYEQKTAIIGITNLFTLRGGTNWAGAILRKSPTNGVISGTPPTITYRTTNVPASMRDGLEYQLDSYQGVPVTNYYGIKMENPVYTNTPPKLTLKSVN